MQYHPHGDASIGDAMVQIKKELLIAKETGEYPLETAAALVILNVVLNALRLLQSKITGGCLMTVGERNPIIFLLNSHC
jgi:hypothetical protein